jgi:hypothetical protein
MTGYAIFTSAELSSQFPIDQFAIPKFDLQFQIADCRCPALACVVFFRLREAPPPRGATPSALALYALGFGSSREGGGFSEDLPEHG